MTAIDVPALVKKLQDAIGSDHHLLFTGALVGSTDISALLAPLFPDGTVDFAGAGAEASGDGKSALAHGTVTFGAAACDGRLTLTPQGDAIALLLTLTPPAGSALPTLFTGVVDPLLTSVVLASAVVAVASGDAEVDGQVVHRGMSVVGQLDLAKSYPQLVLVLGDKPVALSGVVTDPALPLLSLATSPIPATLGSVPLASVVLSFQMLAVPAANGKPTAAARTSLAATVDLGHGIGGTVTAVLPSAGSQIALDVLFHDVNVGDLALLEPFLGPADPFASLPTEIRDAIAKAGSLIGLRSLALTFDAAGPRFLSVGIGLAIDLKHFTPFPPLPHLTLDEVDIAFTVSPVSPPATVFAVTAELHVTERCQVAIGVQTQPDGSYQIAIREATDSVLKVSDVVAAFLPGLPLPELDVTDFVVTMAPRDQFYTLGMTISGTWSALQSLDIAMASVTIDALYQGGVTPPLSGTIAGTVSFELPGGSPAPALIDPEAPGVDPPPGTIDLQVVAQRPPGSDKWVLTGGIGEGESVPVGSLIAALAHKFDTNANVPTPLEGLTMTQLGTRLDEAESSFTFSCALEFPVGDETVEATVDLAITGTSGNRDIAFGGSLLVGQLEFDLRIDHKAGGADVVLGEFVAKGDSGQVDVKKLIDSVLPEVASALPDGLVLDIADAAVAIVGGTGGTRKFLFAMDLSLEFPLSDLPLIGKAVPADAKAGLKDLKLIVTSAPLTVAEVTAINGMSPKPVLPTPAAGTVGDAVPKGFSMVAALELGPLEILMTSPPPPKKDKDQDKDDKASSKALVAAPAAPPAPPAQPDPVSWVEVQKSLGPVTIQKVGFSYRDGNFFVLANLAIAVGGVEIDLVGIGMGSPLTELKPKFTIQGLAVDFAEGPIVVEGGMIGTLEPVDFVGALSVRVPELSLAALAGYAEDADHHPSFFLYGVLSAPLGGPPAFFVTGVAAGFGFNRKLVVPDVAGVETFPLVQWAQGIDAPSSDPAKPIKGQVAAALAKLSASGVVAPSVGDYWFAAGLRFTSFELVDTFALLLVSLGTDVEIDLLGLSTVTIPPMDPSPIAEIQLALEVSFSWSKGLIAVAGQLTNNSYVLSRDCRLTGGFAFYFWFRGEHAGETVLTLGGYNPNFAVPKDYPQVPRLGLNWQVVPELTISGGLYFAVTPNVIMAGGKLSAVWNSGPIKAWFTYWADFLMTFSPFHYYVDGGIDLGASFTVDLWLFSVSVTIHIGVDLALWGPKFAGRAIVDLDIISFTISFNEHAPQDKTSIPWDDFVKQLLPKAEPKRSLRAGMRLRALGATELAAADEPPAAIVQINVTGGMVRALPAKGDVPCYLVTAERFTCAVVVVIPVKDVTFLPDPAKKDKLENLGWAPDSMQPHDAQGNLIKVNKDFGVGPSNIPSAQFQPTLTLSLSSDEDSVLMAVKQLTNAPKALWETKSFDGNGVPRVDPATALTEGSITDALVGLTLVPYVEKPDYTRPIPLESLLFELDATEPFAWSTGSAPTTDPFTDQTVAGTITAPPVSGVRTALLDALAGQGITVDTAVAVAGLADPAGDDLLAPPRLRLLGEQRGATTSATEQS